MGPWQGVTNATAPGFCRSIMQTRLEDYSVIGLSCSAALVLSLLFLLSRLGISYGKTYRELNRPIDRMRQKLLANQPGTAPAEIMLPHYFVFVLVSCFGFVLQCSGWLIPNGSIAFDVLARSIFVVCLFLDLLLFVHVLRPAGASMGLSAVLAFLPCVAALAAVQMLPGGYIDEASCEYCCIHYPKPGVNLLWGPVLKSAPQAHS